MEILGSLIAIIFGVIGVFFMLNLSIDLIRRYRSDNAGMKNSPNRWNIFLEWWFWLTIILLIFASLGEWFK